MEITEEKVLKAKKAFKHEISENAIKMILSKIPDEKMLGMVLPLMDEALSDIPSGTSDEKTVEILFAKLQKKAEGKKDSNPGNAKKYVREYFDSLWLEERLMGSVIPSLKKKIFSKEFDTPIGTAALSHLKTYNPDCDSAMVLYAKAAKKANCVHFVGMCENDEYKEIAATGADIVRIIKPYKDDEKVFSQIKFAEENGALAVGIDIDHTFSEEGNIDAPMGEELGVKSLEQIKAYVNSTKLPFVIKGVLSVHDALKAMEIGAKAIVVSNHGGRMNFAIPPLMVLKEIKDAVKGKMVIFADGGIVSGCDAYKALALGADAVCVGTHLIPVIAKYGADACADRIKEMTKELKGFMANTGVKDTDSFDYTVIHKKA